MPRIVRDIQLLVNDNDDHLYGYRLSDGTEVRIGTSADTDGAAAVVGVGSPRGGTAYVMGDSLGVNNWSGTVLPSFVPIQNAGVHEMANALAGCPLEITGIVAVGATTLTQQITTQLPQVLAARPQYCFISAGTNDIYASALSAAETFAQMQYLVTTLASAGIVPIYSTVWARSYDATYTPRHLAYNDLLRRWVYSGAPGLFWDGFAATVDPTSTQCAIRSGYTYDSSPSLHINNVGALILGKACAAQALSKLPRRQRFAYGAEDATNTGNTSNILTNPNFTGTGGTAGANVTGTVPTGWTVDWATRTGTGAAAASIVDVVNSDTGNADAKAIQVVISGSPAANDVLRITQTGFESQTPSGAVVNSECVLEMAGTIGGVSGVMQRVQTNATESAWWGIDSFASLAYPQGFIAYTKTRNVTSQGGATARFDCRFKFSGAGTPTFRMWLPRVRKVS